MSTMHVMSNNSGYQQQEEKRKEKKKCLLKLKTFDIIMSTYIS